MTRERPVSTQQLQMLRRQMVERFSLEELRALAFDLGIDHERFPDGGKETLARELVQHANRAGQLPALLVQLCALRPSVTWAISDLATIAEPPYRGLDFYREQDAALFFGRARLTAELVERLRAGPFLAVVGASGSGKSSVVRAGVMAALRGETELPAGCLAPDGSDEWAYLTITPTDSPLERLALALTSDLVTVDETRAIIRDLSEEPNSLRLYIRKYIERLNRPRLFLLVDQFEELFTVCKDETQRRAFIEALLAAVDSGSPTTLIITLRADFYHHCAQYDSLRHALEQRQTYIGAPSAGELREAIVEPARQRGYEPEPGLAELMLRDVGDEPGGLPLLSHALLETWARREGRTLTLAGYNVAGGVRGAIAQTAERVYGDLDEAGRAIAQRIFVELAELGEGTEDTRRRLRLEDLAGHTWYEGGGAAVLEGLVRTRLVTADERTVQIAHEALIREWPRLREWLDADRAGERLRRGVQSAAREWDEHGRDASYLFQGARLASAQEWITASPRNLDERSSTFLEVATISAERETKEKEVARQRELTQVRALVEEQAARAAAEARRTRAIRWAAVWLSALAILAMSAAVFAGAQRTVAQRQERYATSRALSFAARGLETDNPTLALLLAVEAGQVSETLESFNALGPAIISPGIEQLTLPHDGRVNSAEWNGDESYILTSGDNGAWVWDANGGEQLLSLPHAQWVYNASWSSDDSRILTACSDGVARVWDADSGLLLMQLQHNGSVAQATWSKDNSKILTASHDGTARIWDTATGAQLLTVQQKGPVNQAAWNRDESSILTAGYGAVHVWNALNGQETLHLPHSGMVYSASWNNEGRILTAGDSGVIVWDSITGQQLLIMKTETEFYQAVWDDRGDQLLGASVDGNLQVWTNELITTPDGIEERWRRRVSSLLLQGNSVYEAEWSSDSSRILTASSDGQARVWGIDSSELLVVLPHEGLVAQAAWNADETRILTVGYDETAKVWDMVPGPELIVTVLTSDDKLLWNAHWRRRESLGSQTDEKSIPYNSMRDLITAACNRLGRNLTWLEWQQYFSDEPYRQTCPNLPVHFTVPEVARP